jgi:hypothetical protein
MSTGRKQLLKFAQFLEKCQFYSYHLCCTDIVFEPELLFLPLFSYESDFLLPCLISMIEILYPEFSCMKECIAKK